jgi:hypothetical protein
MQECSKFFAAKIRRFGAGLVGRGGGGGYPQTGFPEPESLV